MYQNPRHKALTDITNQEEYYKREYLNAAASHKKLFEKKFDDFLSNRRPGKVLDIGCATGEFLEVAKESGWRAFGIDVSQWVCDYLAERGFRDIHSGTLEDQKFPHEMFDAVHMNHVLEHIPNPLEFLAEVHRILKAKGLVMIEVPNEFYFPHNYKLINWVMPDHLPPRRSPASHVSLFTRNTLTGVLKSAGFTAVTVKTEGFADSYRTITPLFRRKTFIMKSAILLCRLGVDKFLGLRRYLVAAAGKES